MSHYVKTLSLLSAGALLGCSQFALAPSEGRRVLPAAVRIKAAGGIRTRAAALALVAAGADRIGSSNSMAMIAENDEPTAAQ